MSIRNGNAREGAFDASQSCLNLYWKISVNDDFVRLMGVREENMKDKFIDEKIYSIEQCINVSFIQNPDLSKVSADIITLSKHQNLDFNDGFTGIS